MSLNHFTNLLPAKPYLNISCNDLACSSVDTTDFSSANIFMTSAQALDSGSFVIIDPAGTKQLVPLAKSFFNMYDLTSATFNTSFPTTIPFSAIGKVNRGFTNNDNQHVSVVTTGVYKFDYNASVSSIGEQTIGFSIYKNNTLWTATSYVSTVGARPTNVGISTIAVGNATDEFSVKIYFVSGTAGTCTVSNGNFSIHSL